jgi:group I intron endonuclease
MPLVGGWKTGVYCILNRANGKRYVGSAARSLARRIRGHRDALNGGWHENRHRQAAWNKYGAAAFVFVVLERCSPSRCIEREQHWIDHYDSCNGDRGYNLCPLAGSSLGYKFSDEQRARMVEVNKKSKANPVVRAKLSAATKAQWDDPATRLSREEANRRRITPEACDRMSRSHLVRYQTTNARQVRSETQTRLWENQEYRDRLSAAHRGKRASTETRAKMVASQRRRRMKNKEIM